MSDTAAQVLLRRLVQEHRPILIGLLLVFLVNLIVWAVFVRPMSQRVANVAGREQAALAALTAARAEHLAASGTLTGKDRATKELASFYDEVLPADVSAARRLTHVRLQQLARRAGLTLEHVSNETVEERNSQLTRLKIEMGLTGPWTSVRTFIHSLESAPEFVVIDNVELSEAAESGSDLSVNVEFSTYFRTPTP